MSHAALLSRTDRLVLRLALLAPLAGLALFFALPVASIAWRSFMDDGNGQWSFINYQEVLVSPAIWRATGNSLLLGLSVTVTCLALGYGVAYALERTAIRGKMLIAAALNLPLMAPSLVLGLGLIFLIGRNGLVSKLLGVRMDPYGFTGLLIANAIYALPFAILILRSALRHGDARLYEAAEMMGARGWRRFIDITWPTTRYGVLSAGFVVFTITITDFGNAVVIGGNFNVLATEIYNQVNGQMKFGLGAVVGIALLLPSLLSVGIEHFARQRQGSHGAESAQPPRPVPHALRDLWLGALAWLVACLTLLVIGIVVVASFMKMWPYQLTWTLANYDVNVASAYRPLWLSIGVSAATAIVGTLLVLLIAISLRYLGARQAALVTMFASIPVAVPGLVLGLGYVLFFNQPGNPLGVLYGGIILLVACNFFHHHAQAFLMLNTSVRLIPMALEDALRISGGGLLHAVRDIYLPWLRVSLLQVAVFLFMMSMVTLSAVIFLVTPENMLASVTVMRLDEAGFTTQAAAYSTCIMAIVAASAAILHALNRHTTRNSKQ